MRESTVLLCPWRSGDGNTVNRVINYRKEIAHVKDSSEFRGQHHITFRLQLAREESFLTVQLLMSHDTSGNVCKLNLSNERTFPEASCENVSSDMMSVTSALGDASPFRMTPLFLRSIVHTASFLSALVIRSSKMPLV